MGAFGDVVQALIGSIPGVSAEFDSSSAPVPTVGSRPGRVAGPAAWSAPNASGHGQVSVHRDTLRTVAGGMRSDLADLDGAVSALNGIRHGAGISITANSGLIAGWPTAVAFNGNASAAFSGVMRASQQTGTAHEDASSRLTTSAAAYDQSESDNQRAVRSVGTNLYSVTGLVASYGNGKSGSSALGTQPSYPVKNAAVSGFSGTGMSADTIMDILHGLNPEGVAAAGRAHTQLGAVLDRVAARLATNAGTLAKGWTGNAAEAAMGQFQQLHTRMATLAQQATQVGSVLSWLGGEVLPQFVSLPDPRTSLASLVVDGAVTGSITGGLPGAVVGATSGLIDDLDGEAQAAANTAAQQYIARLSSYLVVANQSLPENIGATPAATKGSGRGTGSDPSVPGVSGPGSGSGARLALTNVTGITTKTSGPGTKTGSPVTKTTGVTISPVGTGKAPGQPGGVTAPSTLQGATLPGGQVAAPVGTTPVGSPSSAGGLTSGLPGPVPTVSGATTSGATESAVSAGAETLDDATVPNVGPAGADSAGVAAESLDDVMVPNVSQPGAGSAGMAAESLDDEMVPNVGADSAGIAGESLDDALVPNVSQVGATVDSAEGVAPEASGLITGLDEDEAGISAADSPVVGDVIGGQAAQLDAEDTATDADAMAPDDMAPDDMAPDDMEGFPMMGTGGTRREDEQDQYRQSWLYEDDLWRLSANVVPSVIANGK